MNKNNFFNKFYLDKEKDIIINLYNNNDDEIEYILETPNHNTGNLITNLAKVCNVSTVKNSHDMKIITGIIPACINSTNEEVYIFKLGNVHIANIYSSGRIEQFCTIPAIIKTLMSQTKDYKLSIDKTLVNAYISKKTKFRTDLHTHMNASLSPDTLIALGIKHQIRYSLYCIKKFNIILTPKQEKTIFNYRKEVEKKYINSELTGKKLERKINDETYINFADLILNNLDNAEQNILKIRKPLAILKDGQAVFTNLEKVYVNRYIFAKGKISKNKIDLSMEKIEQIPENDIKNIVKQMLNDVTPESPYKNNSLLQDKLLWISRDYQKQGIKYVEIANTTLVRKGKDSINFLEEIHEILPSIEKETGVQLRFLAAIRRVWLTPLDTTAGLNELRENLDVLKAVAKSPYIVGSDIIGEEINDISEFKPVINELVQYAINEDNGFTIRIHAGENDSLRDNVAKSIECIKSSVLPNQKTPRIRIGHGLYTADLNSKAGKQLIHNIKEVGAVLEFQLTSNVRLNNLSSLTNHPLKTYLFNDIKCVQGTDGFGFYGTDTIEEQLALYNLLNLENSDFLKMKKIENEILNFNEIYFSEKSKRFSEFLNGRTIKEAILALQELNIQKSKENSIILKHNKNVESAKVLKNLVTKLPEDKVPIIIAGGSFNARGRETVLDENGKKILTELIKKVSSKKAYFVVGHKMQGYEKALIDISKKLNKKFEINAIIPKLVSENVKNNILEENINGICISPEEEEFGIYKSFNYEIFERRNSVVLAFDGNSPVSNLVQEAKNGKGKAKIYVNSDVSTLREKAKSLTGYVVPFNTTENIVEKILDETPELRDAQNS